MVVMKSSDSAKNLVSPEIRQKYHYWRFRMLYASMAGYSMFYLVRKNLSMAMPGMESELGITKADLGLFLTLNTLLYGLSKFVNGMWADRANPRIFMSIGLLLSASMSVFFGLSSTVLAFGIFWLLNGWFQGMGCPPCIKTLSTWYPSTERGFRFSIWNTSHLYRLIFDNAHKQCARGSEFFIPGAYHFSSPRPFRFSARSFCSTACVIRPIL